MDSSKMIRKGRNQLNLTLIKLAEITGIPRNTIINIEQKHFGVSFETTDKLHSFLSSKIKNYYSKAFQNE